MLTAPMPAGIVKFTVSPTLCVSCMITCPAGSELVVTGRSQAAGVQAPAGAQTLPSAGQQT